MAKYKGIKKFILDWLKASDTNHDIKVWLQSILEIKDNMNYPALGVTVTGRDKLPDGKHLFAVTIRIYVYGSFYESEDQCYDITDIVEEWLDVRPASVSVPKGFGGISGISSSIFNSDPEQGSLIYVSDISFKLKA